MANITVDGSTVTIQVVGLPPTITVSSAYGSLIKQSFDPAVSTNTAMETLTSGSFAAPAGELNAILDVPSNETAATVNAAGSSVTNYLLYGTGVTDFVGSNGTTQPIDVYVASSGTDSMNLWGNFKVFDEDASHLNFASGHDTLFAGNGSDDTVRIANANVTLNSSGNATVAVQFAQNSGGTIDFINGSSNAATIYSGAYTQIGAGGIAADNMVTAFGGAGGGFFVGGLAGNNSLVGGTGAVTLVGGGNNDFLEASSSTGKNILFGGPGDETLVGSSTSGANDFDLGLKYVGLGAIAGYDVVSTSGTGVQGFTLGTGAFTITGSDAVSTVNAFANVYDVIRDASVGGLALTITNFSARDVILLTDSTEAAGGSKFNSLGTDQFGGTLITLADRTTIDLIGINPNTVHTVAGLHGVLGIELTNKSIIPTF